MSLDDIIKKDTKEKKTQPKKQAGAKAKAGAKKKQAQTPLKKYFWISFWYFSNVQCTLLIFLIAIFSPRISEFLGITLEILWKHTGNFEIHANSKKNNSYQRGDLLKEVKSFGCFWNSVDSDRLIISKLTLASYMGDGIPVVEFWGVWNYGFILFYAGDFVFLIARWSASWPSLLTSPAPRENKSPSRK